MKKSFKDRIAELGLSFHKEIGILIVATISIITIGIVAYILLKQLLLLIIAIFCMVIFIFFYLSRYTTLEQKREKEHVDELISLLSYFEIFISNKKNVYTSLKMLIPYSSSFMEDALNTLLLQIDNDKSVVPFIHFANKFSNKVIQNLMMSVYQMVDNGESNRQFDEFDALFATVSREYHYSLIEDRKKELETFNSFPLFGAGAIVIVLTLCILTVVGEMVNVL